MTVKLLLKVCSVAALVLLVFLALGPAKWQPRSGLGFEFDHFVGYFVFTLVFCLAWPRPLVIGAALTENLQSFLPDRSSYFVAALYSAGRVLAAALLAELFIRARRLFQSKWADPNT
jgi:VanZ family protein